MNPKSKLIGALGVGAGLMYLFDPRSGRRRRALLRDGFIHARRAGERTLRGAARKALNDLKGVVAGVKPVGAIPDALLAERIRSQIGHAVRRPRAVRIEVHDGRAVLSGQVLCGEVRRLLKRVERVKGVVAVRNDLEACEAGDRTSASAEN